MTFVHNVNFQKSLPGSDVAHGGESRNARSAILYHNINDLPYRGLIYVPGLVILNKGPLMPRANMHTRSDETYQCLNKIPSMPRANIFTRSGV